MKQWIQEQNDKLPSLLKPIPDRYRHGNHPFPARHWDKELSAAEAEKIGLPKVEEPAKLVHLCQAAVEGQTLIYAEYNISERNNDSVLYVKQPTDLKPLLELILCSTISLVQLGPQAPILVMTRDSACVEGTHIDRLFRLQQDGTLKPVADLAGYHGNWTAFDIDRDGLMEIVDTKGLNHYPPNLKEKLIKMNLYDESEMPALRRFNIYKWKNDKFESVGRYFGLDNKWEQEPRQ